MSKEQDNKAIVGRWFTDFWGNPWNPKIVDELAAPDILLQYSLHAPRRGREDVKNFMIDFRAAFPDLEFGGAAAAHAPRPRTRAIPARRQAAADPVGRDALPAHPARVLA